MKYLSLLRHAEAEQPLGIADKERNLSSYGAQMAPRLGRRLEQSGFMPDLVVASPATRTDQTARIICYELGYPIENMAIEENIYRATLFNLLALVQGLDEKLSHVLLVGHNPSLSELANFLCTVDVPSHMATCALVRMKLPVEYWALVDGPVGQFIEYDTPENMG